MIRIRRNVYLDNNATTLISKKAVDKLNSVLLKSYGNPSSLYMLGRNSAAILEESREQVAHAINAAPKEIIFTGSATEANNSVLVSLYEYFSPLKNKIITTPIEHSSVLETLNYLANRGAIIEYLKVDNSGIIILDDLVSKVDQNTFLVSIIYANNEIGTIQDIDGIAQITTKNNVLLMADCVQALGKFDIDVIKMGIDYATFSAHKVHGPKGVGAIYIKEGAPFTAYIKGGHQEDGLRAGTECLHNIAAFGESCSDINIFINKSKKVLELKEYLVQKIIEINKDIVFHSPRNNCLPNTLNLRFPGYDNGVLMAMLDYNGISVSAGSACNTKENAPSHVLKAIGLSDQEARETIRVSLSTKTKKSQIDYFINTLKNYFSNEKSLINIVSPTQLNEDLLFNPSTYIVDVRFGYDRKYIKGLPNSNEAGFLDFYKYLHKIPRDKNILLVCQGGYNAPIIAYYLHKKRFKNVSVLLTGMLGWKIANPTLYQKYAGFNIKKL